MSKSPSSITRTDWAIFYGLITVAVLTVYVLTGHGAAALTAGGACVLGATFGMGLGERIARGRGKEQEVNHG